MRHYLSCVSVLLVVTAASVTAAGDRVGDIAAAPPDSTGGPSSVLLYTASGVRMDATVATVVLCTNVGAVSGSVLTVFRNHLGAISCSVADPVVPPGWTTTLSASPVPFYIPDGLCASAPAIQQGSVSIVGDATGGTDFECTVQVLDRLSASTPTFMTRLDLYDRFGLPVRERALFLDGFESGGTFNWSATVP